MRLFKCAGLVASAVAMALLSGCGGGGHSGGGSGTGGGGGTAGSNTFKLKSNVVELDKSQAVVTSVTDGTVVMTGAPILKPGQILIHNATDETRFVRKVVSSSVSGATTSVTTSAADINDVFDSANIVQDAYIPAADLLKLQPAQDGVTFTPYDPTKSNARGLKAREDGTKKISVNFANFQVKDGNGQVIADVNGTVTLGLGLETIWKKNTLAVFPYEAGVSGLASVQGTLTAHARASGTFSREVPVSFSLPIPVTPLGPLGINLSIQMLMKVDGSYTADGQFSLKIGVDASAGIHYDDTNHWQFTYGWNPTTDFKVPALTGSLEFGVSMIRPSVSADILGFGHAYVKADAMKAIAKVSGQTTPVPGILLEGYGDFGFTAGGALSIGPWTLWQDERNFDLGRFSIYRSFTKTLAPTDSMIAYTEASHARIHIMNGDGSGDRVLVNGPVANFTPNVSNANHKVCYVTYDKSTYTPLLYTINADGSSPTNIPVNGMYPENPVWNPAGTEIAFSARDSGGTERLYVVNVGTKSVRSLTAQAYNGTNPVWSPDGSTIYFVFQGYKKVLSRTSSNSPTYDVVLANDSLDYTSPSANPSGTLLVCKQGTSQVALCSTNGQNVNAILNSSAYSNPKFSPDGTRIIMEYLDGSTSRIVSCDLNGGDLKTLGTGVEPSWGLSH